MKTFSFSKHFPKILQWILNTFLVCLSFFLIVLMAKEFWVFAQILFMNESSHHSNEEFLANVLMFFLYFEFVTMIVKYFKENYHFPLRYFIYIGITALIRLIIIDHSDASNSLLYGIVVLLLIVGYFIINLTPLERPKNVRYTIKNAKVGEEEIK